LGAVHAITKEVVTLSTQLILPLIRLLNFKIDQIKIWDKPIAIVLDNAATTLFRCKSHRSRTGIHLLFLPHITNLNIIDACGSLPRKKYCMQIYDKPADFHKP